MRIRKPSPAMFVACLALGITLSGVSYAVTVLPKNSVGPPQLKKNAVTSVKVKDRSLRGVDFALGELPAGQAGLPGPRGESGLLADFNQLHGLPCRAAGKTGVVAQTYSEQSRLSSSSSGNIFTDGAGIHFPNLRCLTEDAFEQNDLRTQAADLTSGWGAFATSQPTARATISPGGDDDWYVVFGKAFRDQYGNSKYIAVRSGTSQPVAMDVYRDGTQVASNVSNYESPDFAAHNWEVRVTGAALTDYRLLFGCHDTSYC